VTEIPAFAYHPIRKAAVMAMNSRDGKPTPDIRCGVAYRGRSCRRPLGGIWMTRHGTILLVNRLGYSLPREDYQRILRSREEREGLWREQGFVDEEPILVHLDGRWHHVPGAEDKATVLCPRHGSWALDLAPIKRLTPRQLRESESIGSSRPH